MRLSLLLLALFSIVLTSCPLGSVFNSNFNKCYQYYNTPTSFIEAEKTCEKLGGNLVEISNGFENTYVAGLLTISTAYWIGANYLMRSKWMWTTGDVTTYTNWAPGQPTDPSISQCATVRPDNYLWTKEQCNFMRPFVCSFDPSMNNTENCGTMSPISTTTATSSCPSDLICSLGQLYPGNCQCYFVLYNMLTWSQNQEYCSYTWNGTLVKIDSFDLNNFIRRNVANTWPWLGLSCSTTNINSCRWLDGSLVTLGYNNFAPGEPKYASPITYGNNGMWYTVQDPLGEAHAMCVISPIFQK